MISAKESIHVRHIGEYKTYYLYRAHARSVNSLEVRKGILYAEAEILTVCLQSQGDNT